MILLIADDEMMIRKGLLSLPWDSVGITEVLSAENGLEAKEILTKRSVDIMLSDIRMPGATGLQVADYISQYAIDTAVILLTGFSEFEYAQEAIKHHVYDYILKPLKPKDILETVASVKGRLEQKRYQAQIVREHEVKAGCFDTITQIQNCFADVNQQVMEMLTYIGQEFDQDISLNGLAERYHFSTTYVSRLFKKETGFSFSDILTGIRLMNSIDMLKKDRDKIGVICDKVGFRDQRYYSQAFKKVLGCTPGDYKKNPRCIRLKEILDIMQQ